MIEALYAASEAGTPIELIVRSICSLRPGVEGLSANITVRSGVGRYLEHSRIFVFGRGDDRRYFIGSADMRARNLDRRIEVVLPVEDPALQRRLAEVIDANLSDTDQGWELRPDGKWDRLPPSGRSAQEHLQHLAVARSGRTSLGTA